MEQTLKQDSGSSEQQGPVVAYSKLYSLANSNEKCLMYLGWISASITGLGLPSFAFLFGDILNAFGPGEDPLDKISTIALIMSCIGVGIGIMSYLYYSLLLISSEKIVRKTRTAYIEAILR